MTASRQTKTIPEFLADAPDVDSMEIWSAFWNVLTELRDRTFELFDVAPHASSSDLESWSTRDGRFEGSLNTYTGPEAEWVVHSWIGNRRQSILDMNFQVWLGPHIDVPHLVVVFGTIPQVFHYSDFIPRRDLMADLDHLRRYYEPENDAFLALRGDDRFTWSVSHGTYMRAVLSPVGYSYVAERSDDVVAALRDEVLRRFEQWAAWIRAAAPVPEAEREALRRRDRFLREHIYRLDPMNELAKGFLGPDMFERLVAARWGRDQIAEASP